MTFAIVIRSRDPNLKVRSRALTKSRREDAPSLVQIVARFFQKFFRLSVPPNSVVKVGRVDHHNVARTIPGRRQPEQTVKFGVARSGEWVRSIRIDRLARQHLHGLAVVVGQFVVRQVWMKVECGNIVKQPKLVQIAKAVSGAMSRVPSTSAGRKPQRFRPGSQAPSATNARRN